MQVIDERILTEDNLELTVFKEEDDSKKYLNSTDNDISSIMRIRLENLQAPDAVSTSLVGTPYELPKDERSYRLLPLNGKDIFKRYTLLRNREEHSYYYWLPLIFNEDSHSILVLLMRAEKAQVEFGVEQFTVSFWFSCIGDGIGSLLSNVWDLSDKRSLIAYLDRINDILPLLGLNYRYYEQATRGYKDSPRQREQNIKRNIGRLYDIWYRQTQEQHDGTDTALLFNDEWSQQLQARIEKLEVYSPRYIEDGFGEVAGLCADTRSKEIHRTKHSIIPDVLLHYTDESQILPMGYGAGASSSKFGTNIGRWMILGAGELLRGKDKNETYRIWEKLNSIGPMKHMQGVNYLLSIDDFLEHLDLYYPEISFKQSKVKQLHKLTDTQAVSLRRINAAKGTPLSEQYQVIVCVTLPYNEFINNTDRLLRGLHEYVIQNDLADAIFFDLLDTENLDDISECLIGNYNSLRSIIGFSHSKTKDMDVYLTGSVYDCIQDQETKTIRIAPITEKIGDGKDTTKLAVIALMEELRRPLD